MRMWMVDPKKMCRKHLLGEHGELHKFLSGWKKKRALSGYVVSNAIEPSSYKKRHDKIAREMKRRGYKHKSPLKQPDFSYLNKIDRLYKVNVMANELLLATRCKECQFTFKGVKQYKI